MDDKVAGIAKPVRMSLRQGIRKSAPIIGCLLSATMNVQVSSRLRPTLTTHLIVP